MSKRETKFIASWSEKYAWISKDKICIHSGRCTLCSTSFSIRNVGISDVSQHSKTAIHLKNEKQMRSQCTFKTSPGSLTGSSKPTTKDKFWRQKSCRLQTWELKMTRSLQRMVIVTDSKKCSRTCKLLRNILKKKQNPNMLSNLVSLLLLKTNWLLMHKKLNTPLNSTKLWLPKRESSMMDTPVFSERNCTQNCNIILWYLVCWSLYSWCSSCPFFRVVRDLGLDLNLLLALRIDGPNFNKSFKSKLAEELQEIRAAHFLDVVTCSIHIASNAFLEGIRCLKDSVNVDQFAIDLHFSVKLSATRREDYRGVSELTDVTMHYV